MGLRGAEPRDISEIVKVADWEKVAFDLAKDGGSIVEICVAIGISRSTLTYLRKRDTKVADLVEYWRMLAESRFQKDSRDNLTNKDFSYQGLGMIMKNRFEWDQKQQIDITSNGESINLPVIDWVNEDRDKEDKTTEKIDGTNEQPSQ